MRAHQNTWGRVSQALKVGYGIWKDGLCIIERKQGTDASRCAGKLVGFDCTCAKLSNHKKGKQMIMMSFNDVTVVLLRLREGGYIREHAQAPWGSLG